MTREQIDAIERLLAKATPAPWGIETPIDDDNPWIVEADKPSYDWRCLAMVTKADDDINVTEGSANADLLIALRNNAQALLAAARRALELEEALEWMAERWLVLLKAKASAGWCVCTLEKNAVVAIGSTPLEAINNARRGM